VTERPPEGDAKGRDRDIADVIREELARRRPVDADAVRERRRLERDYL